MDNTSIEMAQLLEDIISELSVYVDKVESGESLTNEDLRELRSNYHISI